VNEAVLKLERFLTDDITTEGAEKQFKIETKEQANWAMRKIANIEKDRSETRLAAQSEIERVEAWLENEEKRADQAREYLDFLLEDYHRRLLKENKKAKTIQLLHGVLQLRAQQPEFTKDDERLLTWAKENRPELVVTPPPPEPKLDWAGLKKIIKVVDGKAMDPSTGEIIPGITVIERSEKFNIKVSGV